MEQEDSPGKSGSGGRLKSYKYKGLDAREMRRQREEEGVQLRKQKKEELVSNRHSYHCVFGSRSSDHYFRSVCLSVCLFVCLCRVFLSRL